jgi:hypothetical protein
MSDNLATRHCKPCEGGVDPLQPDQVQSLMKALHADWVLSDDGLEISRTFAAQMKSLSDKPPIACVVQLTSQLP